MITVVINLIFFIKILILLASVPVSMQITGFIARKLKLKLHPIDFKKFFIDNKRIFGDGKSIEGSLVGVLSSIVLSVFLDVNIKLAFLIGIGAVFGDIFESFIKRRIGKERGEDWYPWDSIDFYIGAVLFSQLWNYIKIIEIIVIGIILIFIHPIMTKVAKILGIKEVK